jgi:hypothetical protein
MSRFLIDDWIRRIVPVEALSPLFIALTSAALMSSLIMIDALAASATILQR